MMPEPSGRGQRTTRGEGACSAGRRRGATSGPPRSVVSQPVRSVRAVLPLNPPVFTILVALSGGPVHAYGIMREVEQQTDGKASIPPGTLYPAIRRLVGRGLIERTLEQRGRARSDARRRYYRLTAFGREVVDAEIARLGALIRMFEGDTPMNDALG